MGSSGKAVCSRSSGGFRAFTSSIFYPSLFSFFFSFFEGKRCLGDLGGAARVLNPSLKPARNEIRSFSVGTTTTKQKILEKGNSRSGVEKSGFWGGNEAGRASSAGFEFGINHGDVIGMWKWK